ncbi:dehydrogenase [Photobacterium ganghwense]|uniref:Dihydrolipoamide acetyltransferase component of pyruvate dehydrogenase complex n=1 Tax=Photobacterium ganghwense TaxID=320778 RepID=A0A0J1K1G3_9GAMM|nr:dihydrolipoamide acetyltransferase family protein [Photobacterium ganghwense]KLV08282.1 dehydrogenase [Photobacterium ganghwense]QSV16154.1 2-oxo acid dehydrogenase subunit E2 [Photobacterium ganghwense]
MSSQSFDIVMPSLGADMRDGTLTEWMVAEGDHVNKGDSIAVIETSKGAIEMESYHSGTISKILVQPVISLPVGSILASIEADTIEADTLPTAEQVMAPPDIPQSETSQPEIPEPLSPQAYVSEASISGPNVSEPSISGPIMAQPAPSEIRILASPAARTQARQHDLNLASIVGSGPMGAILLRDLDTAHQVVSGYNVEPTASAQQTAVPAAMATAAGPSTQSVENTASRDSRDNRDPAAMRAAIAAAMEKSKREIPHYYLSLDVDLTRTQQWLNEQNAGRDPEHRLLLPALLLKAIATVLPNFPSLNGYFQNGEFKPEKAVHIGTVISLREGGLMVPAIHDVSRLSVDDTMLALRDISNRSRTGRLRSSELTDATITLTSIGERGSDSVFGVIYPPQVAILGAGRLRQTLQVRTDDKGYNQIAICDTMTVTLSADHRVSDGIQGAKFLHALSQQLQKPEQL